MYSGAMEKHPALVALGEQIRTVRRRKGISQKNIAALAGLSRAYYGSVERGERNVAALGVEVGELFPIIQPFSSFLGGAGVNANEE